MHGALHGQFSVCSANSEVECLWSSSDFIQSVGGIADNGPWRPGHFVTIGTGIWNLMQEWEYAVRLHVHSTHSKY